MNICRYCDKPIEGEPVKTISYWQQVPLVCHTECKQPGERQEALDCQTIDADCNDCRHYQRGQLAPKIVSILRTPDKRLVEVTFQPNEIIGGRCLKFDRTVTAYPHTFTGRECFEHRRAA